MTFSVRRAVVDDIPWLLGELRAFDVFFGASRSLFPDIETAEMIITAYVTQHVFFVVEKAEERVGFIAGLLVPHMYNPALTYLSEAFWWVTPKFRGSRAGLLLFNAFEDHGRKNGAHAAVMTLEADSPINPETLTRRGYVLKETSYLREFI